MPYTVEFKVRTEQMRKRLARLHKLVPETVRRVLDESLLAMQTDVIANKLSGQYLGVVTGTARKSPQYRTHIDADRVWGELGTPFRYVAAHEEGFHGSVKVPGHNVRAHTRRMTTRRGFRKVEVRSHSRRPHSRMMNIRARHFFRDSITEGLPATKTRLRRGIVLMLRRGTIPSQGELRG